MHLGHSREPTLINFRQDVSNGPVSQMFQGQLGNRDLFAALAGRLKGVHEAQVGKTGGRGN